MKLIGMLDSPYVRRTAISLELYGVDFAHHSLSVFRTYDEFAKINPVVKAPTLVMDDATVLMDSNLIIDYFETLAPAGKKLLPQTPEARARDLRQLGLTLAACEKTVQIVYERNLRPAEKQHEPWVSRVTEQLLAAYTALEKLLSGPPSPELTQASLTTAVAWSFTQFIIAPVVDANAFPNLQRHTQFAEQHPAFKKYPME